jgi:hypothetical protein
VTDPDQPSPELWAQVNEWLEELKAEQQMEETIPGFSPPPREYRRPTGHARPRQRLYMPPVRQGPRQVGPQRPQRPQPPVEAEKPKSGLAAVFMDRFPGLTAKAADAYADKWAVSKFSPAEVLEWMNGGLPCNGWVDAWDYRAAGITPEMLTLVIRGETPLSRMRRGYMSVGQVADMLLREGHMKSGGAGSA